MVLLTPEGLFYRNVGQGRVIAIILITNLKSNIMLKSRRKNVGEILITGTQDTNRAR